MNMRSTKSTGPDTIAVKLEGQPTAREWQALVGQYLAMAKRTGVVRFFAEVHDGSAWESLVKFIYLVRWKLLDTPAQQRVVVATPAPLMANGTGLLATHTPNLELRIVGLEEQAEAQQWLFGR